MDLEQTVIKNIKKYRKLRNLSQEKLAEKCGTATSYIGLVEIGQKIPKIATLERIAIALEVESYLFFIEEPEDCSFNDDMKIDAILVRFKEILKQYG